LKGGGGVNFTFYQNTFYVYFVYFSVQQFVCTVYEGPVIDQEGLSAMGWTEIFSSEPPALVITPAVGCIKITK
jgi:hypothetical protein